jgi:hypothetical protein
VDNNYKYAGRYALDKAVTTCKWPLKLYLGIFGLAVTQVYIMWYAHQLGKKKKHAHFDFLMQLQAQMVKYQDGMVLNLQRYRLHLANGFEPPPDVLRMFRPKVDHLHAVF